MIVLGFDPGVTRIGYGVVTGDKRPSFVECGLINAEKISARERLLFLEKELGVILKKHKPDVVGVEKLYFSKNKKTALAVSEARGVIMLAAEKSGASVFEYTPNNIKSVVAGNGGCGKKELADAVSMTLGVHDIPGPDDVTDALAIAIRAFFDRGF